MSNIETRLLSKILNTKDLKPLVKASISSDFFHGVERDLFLYIRDYYTMYGVVPTLPVVARRYPKFIPVITKDEPYLALIDELRERETYNYIRDALEDAAEVLPTNVEKAYKRLVKAIATISAEVRVSEDRDWVGNAPVRIQKYDFRRKRKEYGIPTFWKQLDKLMMGFQDYHLITLAGRPGIGKSWWVCLNAYAAWCKGWNPLIISKEMAVEEIERRLDAIHAKVGYEHLRASSLSHGQRINYKVSLRYLKTPNTIYVAGEELSAGGVLSLATKIEEYHPEIVFVDGVYLLSDDKGGNSKTEQIYNIVQDMKRLARRYKIPIVQTAQMGRGTFGGAGGEDRLAKIQWGDVFGQSSDEVIELHRAKRDSETVTMEVTKQREGRIGKFEMKWDLNKMDFQALSLEYTKPTNADVVGESSEPKPEESDNGYPPEVAQQINKTDEGLK